MSLNENQIMAKKQAASEQSINLMAKVEAGFSRHPDQNVRQLGPVLASVMHEAGRERNRDVKEMFEANRQAEGFYNAAASIFRDNVGINAGSLDSPVVKKSAKQLLATNEFAPVAKSLDKVVFGDQSEAVAKSVLDVGTLTNFANVTQGQSLGYFSLDTNLIRGTIRPGSFTLYASLPKSSAFQVVDFWTVVDRTGGAPPGSAFNPYSVASNPAGYAQVNASVYDMDTITLSLMSDARAVSVALAAQNNFVDVAEQETISAALSLLSTAEWTSFWGNQSVYAQQFNGLFNTITNRADWFQTYIQGQKIQQVTSNTTAAVPQSLFNMMMVLQANVAKYTRYGMVSHFHMDPNAIADIQATVTTQLQNFINLHPGNNIAGRRMDAGPITVAGDIQGMTTRFGQAQFCNSILIPARDTPITAQTEYSTAGNNYELPSALQPSSVTAVVNASGSQASYFNDYSATVSGWNFLPGPYVYAVVACDTNMNETYPVFTAPVTGLTAGCTVALTITPPNPNTNITSYRVFRSGMGYNLASGQNPADFRYIGEVAFTAGSTTAQTFVDTNGVDIVSGTTKLHRFIPGSSTIFGTDMHPESKALDWRYLLPLTKVELFSGNYLMPWAVVMIGAIRNLLPKYHGVIKNYIPIGSEWSPFSPNIGATTFG